MNAIAAIPICDLSSRLKQAISAHEWALCQLTVCFQFQSRSERRKQHKSFVLQMDSEVKNVPSCIFVLYCVFTLSAISPYTTGLLMSKM